MYQRTVIDAVQVSALQNYFFTQISFPLVSLQCINLFQLNSLNYLMKSVSPAIILVRAVGDLDPSLA